MKRRISKWDVAAELHVETVEHDSVLPVNVDDPRMDITEVDSINPITEVDSINPITEVDSINPITEVDSIDPITEVDSINPILSINADNSEINQSDKQPVEERNNNIIHSDDIFEKTQSSEQLDVDCDHKDGFKKQDCESVSQDRTMAEYSENQDKPRNGAYDRSPVPEDRHMRNPNMSPVDDRSRSHRKRSRSRSLSYGSRGKSRSKSKSRSRSRSKSPSYISKQDSERWTDKGRMRGMTPSCRAFAAGKCAMGNECRFLHEGSGWREIDRHHDAVLPEGRGSRLERERHLAYGSKESITDTREKNNYTREKPFRRPEERHEDGGSHNIQHQGYRSNERCFDFFVGRCNRGSACRYIHHDASSDGGWSVRDDSRGRLHDRRDGGSASFNRRLEHQRPSDVPCKYFLRGHCLHGENCKFYHQAEPHNTPVERPLVGSHSGPAGNNFSANASELKYQTARLRVTNPRVQNESGMAVAHPIGKQNFTNRSQSDSHPALTRDVHKETQPSESKTTAPKVCEELSANNPSSTVSIAGKNAESRGQSQFAPQLLLPQNFASNSSFQQFASPLPLTGQMQQVMHSHSPQNGKNQFTAVHKPPDDHSLNASYQLNPQNLDPRGKTQQNLPMISHSGNNFNLNKQFQQNGPLIPTPHNQSDLSVGAQIQRNITSHIGPGHQDLIGSGDSQQILPQNLQIQVQNLPSHASNGKNHLLVAPQPSSNPHIFNSDEKNCELTTKNNSTQIAQGADSVELIPSPFNSDNSISHKVVTIEQAAKITDLSASLAQFFGATARNSQSSSGVTPQAFLNQSSISSFATTALPLPTEVEGSQTNLSHSSSNPNQQTHAIENVKQVDDSSSKEVKKTEAHESNKEQLEELQNGDAESKKDGESRKIKDAKEIRMFKCSLVEFVKEILKPKWKEGQLSKEAYKTIVKKVVDKVCGSLQGNNVPQTQEKIDLYLLNAKAKLSKLVQAYVEKFVNS